MKSLISWFARNHVAANLLMMMLIVGGIGTLRTIPLKTFPDLDIEVIVISVPYLGAAPEEVERGVCIRIEEEIEGITGIDTIKSTASEGICSVGVELLMGADPLVVLDRIKNRVDAISTFPEETEKPIVSQYVIRRAAVDIAISGNTDERSLKIIERYQKHAIFVLPRMSNQKFNDYIKEACAKAEINSPVTIDTYKGNKFTQKTFEKHEVVTAHVARKTFITLSYYLGMKTEYVKKITGINQEKTLRKYLKD